MIIEKYIIYFWQGKLKLWQSFWLVGGLVGIIIGQILIFLKEFIFSNYAQNPNDFPIGIKLLILMWIIYSTVGIWRSSENYKGYYFWKISTKIRREICRNPGKIRKFKNEYYTTNMNA